MDRGIIITIGRSFGSNGRIIGERVAKSLGINFYDRNLIERAAEESNIDWKLAGSADEKLIGGLLKFGPGFEFMQENPNDKIYRAQEAVIHSIMKSGESCVIVGRGADYVLRNRPEVLKTFIYAPHSFRVETVMERYKFTKKEAEKAVRYMDKTRRNYYEYFTDGNWDQKEGKDLLIDSSTFGIEGAVSLIRKAVECKQKKDWDDL
ncbi:MAG: cytidylate kinase-like family protein [Lachnospiraceae bacterium]|nr:cytidylate kinase-like family protein [Lachnospiraceae bacterium]